jgi:hypothetical protein
MFDIIFISYDEPRADETFAQLVSRFPYIQRVSGVQGIDNAHYAAAKLSRTEMFYIIDGDNEPLPDFDFDFVPAPWDRQYTHIWPTKNIVNGCVYGYGGIKLFNTAMLTTNKPTHWVDFCSTRGAGIKYMESRPISITHFDQTPLHTYRATAREVFKLFRQKTTIETLLSHDDLLKSLEYRDVLERLSRWITEQPNTEFDDAYHAGISAAQVWYSQKIDPTLINNFAWLTTQWLDTHDNP